MCLNAKERGRCFHNTSYKKECTQIGCSVEVNPSCGTLSDLKKLLSSSILDLSVFIFTCQNLLLNTMAIAK